MKARSGIATCPLPGPAHRQQPRNLLCIHEIQDRPSDNELCGREGPLTTSWQPARLLPGSAHPARAPSGTWRLVSYLVTRGWQENTAGPEPGWLTCPTAATCYVEGDSSTSPSGPADMNSFYVSTDSGQTWNVLPVPAHVTFTSALSCASATECAVGGLYYITGSSRCTSPPRTAATLGPCGRCRPTWARSSISTVLLP